MTNGSSSSSNTSNGKKKLRIRRTKQSDLHTVSTMLAMESITDYSTEERQSTVMNWNKSIKLLRAKSILEKQLQQRLMVVEEGRKTFDIYKRQQQQQQHRTVDATMRSNQEECFFTNNHDYDTCHLLWSNSSFKTKLKQAVSNTNEMTPWKAHNFDLTPVNSELLNHVMMSVVVQNESDGSGSSEEVVGFCEVAWLPCPSLEVDGTHDDALLCGLDDDVRLCVTDESLTIPRLSHVNDDDVMCNGAPAIVNLVTSAKHRRIGIASKLINFASKYTRTQWCRRRQSSQSQHKSQEKSVQEQSQLKQRAETKLGLYVHPENDPALQLYRRRGFEIVSSDVSDGLLYMSMV